MLIVALGCLSVPMCSGQWVPVVEGGGVLTLGAHVPVGHLTSTGSTFADNGAGWQAGVLFLKRGPKAQFGLGARIGQRTTHQQVAYDTVTVNSPSSFKKETWAYDGRITAERLAVCIPVQLWLDLGARSHLMLGIESRFAVDASIMENGDRTVTTLHYAMPTYEVSSSDTEVTTYERELSTRVQEAIQFALGVGYRHRLGERWLLGADASVVVPTCNGPEITGPVGEVGLSIGWIVARNVPGAVPVER